MMRASRSPPLPRPRMNRPAEMSSRASTSRMSCTGWWLLGEVTKVPRRMRSVTAAAAARVGTAANHGESGSPAHVTWSKVHAWSKPIASAARHRGSAIAHACSGRIVRPNRMAPTVACRGDIEVGCRVGAGRLQRVGLGARRGAARAERRVPRRPVPRLLHQADLGARLRLRTRPGRARRRDHRGGARLGAPPPVVAALRVHAALRPRTGAHAPRGTARRPDGRARPAAGRGRARPRRAGRGRGAPGDRRADGP